LPIMLETGKIIAVSRGGAIVELAKNSVCGHCAACQKGESGQLMIEVDNDLVGRVGDEVEIAIADQQVAMSLMIIFLGPLIALFLGYWLGSLFSESAGIAAALLSAGLVLLFLRLFDVPLGKRARGRIVRRL